MSNRRALVAPMNGPAEMEHRDVRDAADGGQQEYHRRTMLRSVSSACGPLFADGFCPRGVARSSEAAIKSLTGKNIPEMLVKE